MKRILALALLALLAGSGPAAADPISIAILGALSIAATPFAVGVTTFLLTTVASFALSFVSSLFRPKPKKAEGGVQSQIQIGGDVPRSAIFGKQATAGHIVYVNTYGTNNAMLEMVFALGDGQHEGLSRVWVNGKLHGLTQPGAETHYVVDDFESKLTLTFVSGTESQTALAALVTNANPAGRWTANHTLSGIAYVVARFQFDEKVFANGIPQLLFEMEGLRLYDPRLDSTNGGSGSHRWDNPATWAYSENPAIHLYNYQRGIFLNGERVLGMGLPATDLNTESYVAAANICDETVSLQAGGSEPRYRCGFNVSDGMQHSEVIDRFVEAMGGVIAERAGQYTVFAGVAQTSVVTITDGDLVLGKPRTYSAKKSRSERVNAVFGTYSNPDEQWKAVAFPAFTSEVAEADDGGERIAVNLDLAQVFSVTQAQRLAMIERRLGRLQGTAEISLPFAFIRLEAGDWITWNSDRFGFEKVWQVASARIEADQTIRVSLREIATIVYSWVSGDDELDVVQPGVGPGRPPLAGGVSAFAVAPSTYVGESLSVYPIIQATWNAIEDETVTAVLTEHRLGASGTPIRTAHKNVLSGVGIISDGIQAGSYYEVRATIETFPAREVSWTAWKPVVTGNASISTGSASYHALDALMRTVVDNASGVGASSVREMLREIEMRLEGLGEATAREASSSMTLIAGVEGRSKAAIITEQVVRATEDQALATSITALSSDLDDVIIDLGGLETTVSGHATAISLLETDVSAIDGELSSQATAITAIESSITDIEGDVLGLGTAVSSLTTDVSTLDGEVSSISTAITAVEAEVDDLNASGIFKVTAVVSPPTGATSGFQMLVKASDSGNFASAGIKAYAQAGGGGSPQGYTVLVGNRIYREPSSGGTPVLMVDDQGRFVGDALGSGIVNTYYEFTRPERAGDDTMGTGNTASGTGNGWYVDGTDLVGSITIPANPNAIGAGAPNSTYGAVLTTVNASVRNTVFGWALGSAYPLVVAFRVRFDDNAGGVYWSEEGLIACSSGYTGSAAAYGFGGNPGVMTDIVPIPAGTYSVYLEYRWGPRTQNGITPTPSDPNGVPVRISAKIVCLLLKK